MTDGGASTLPAYDAGRLLEPHGASDDWWHDAIREILASAHAHYVRHAADLCPAVFAPPGGEAASIDTALNGAEALRRIYSEFIVNRGDMTDVEALEAIRQICERSG